MPVPLDEFPIHQVPLSMRYVATSDRNFFDRWYFNAHDRTGDVFLITGMGVYKNLGVIDAFATVRIGERQLTVRSSDAYEDRLLDAAAGPLRIEVIEPLQKIRVVCDAADRGIGFDLVWEGSFPCVDEARHLMHHGPRVIMDSWRYAQVGSWSGTLNIDGRDLRVTPHTWMGSRDRAWGIRPSGESDPPGRGAETPPQGFWWVYVPLRFDDFMLIVIMQEDAHGNRTLNEATRVFADGRHEQLGWPEIDLVYRSGTRHPERAVIHMRDRARKPVTVEVETLTSVALNTGAGYGDPEWRHGEWKGRGWVDSKAYDLKDPQIAARGAFGVVDHVARATCDGAVGWGLFEHATIGRHDPTGFKDFSSVAP